MAKGGIGDRIEMSPVVCIGPGTDDQRRGPRGIRIERGGQCRNEALISHGVQAHMGRGSGAVGAEFDAKIVRVPSAFRVQRVGNWQSDSGALLGMAGRSNWSSTPSNSSQHRVPSVHHVGRAAAVGWVASLTFPLVS